MSEQTAHEQYSVQVSEGGRSGRFHVVPQGNYIAERITSLASERDAYLAALIAKQRDIDALLAENAALLAENAELRRSVAAAQGEARKWRRAYSGETEVA